MLTINIDFYGTLNEFKKYFIKATVFITMTVAWHLHSNNDAVLLVCCLLFIYAKDDVYIMVYPRDYCVNIQWDSTVGVSHHGWI